MGSLTVPFMNAVRCFHRGFNLLILILSAGLASLESTGETHTKAVPETLDLGGRRPA